MVKIPLVVCDYDNDDAYYIQPRRMITHLDTHKNGDFLGSAYFDALEN